MDELFIIPDFPAYRITKDGKVYSLKWGKIKELKPYPSTCNGYQVVNLRENGKRYSRLVHRLILTTFKGKCPEGMEARHLDGDKENNHVDNLEWGTRQQNLNDKLEHGTDISQNPDWHRKFVYENKARGSKHGLSKLTEDDVLAIRRLAERRVKQSDIARIFEVAESRISAIVNRKEWTHI